MTVFSMPIHFASPHEEKLIPNWPKFRRNVEEADLSPQQQSSAEFVFAIRIREIRASQAGEDHHLVPKALNGHLTHHSNIVRLRAGDHFVVHVHYCLLFPGCPELERTVAMMAGGKTHTRSWNMSTNQSLLANELLIAAVEAARDSHGERQRERMWNNDLALGNSGNPNPPKQWGNKSRTGMDPTRTSFAKGNKAAQKPPHRDPEKQAKREASTARKRLSLKRKEQGFVPPVDPATGKRYHNTSHAYKAALARHDAKFDNAQSVLDF